MPKLIAPAEVVVWGLGCESKPVVTLRCEPLGGGAFVSIEAVERGSERRENLLLDSFELDALVVALTDPDFCGREVVDEAFPWTSSAIGQVNLALPLDSGRLEHMVDDREPQRLVALADFLIALVERAGIPLAPAFHPIGTR